MHSLLALANEAGLNLHIKFEKLKIKKTRDLHKITSREINYVLNRRAACRAAAVLLLQQLGLHHLHRGRDKLGRVGTPRARRQIQ